MAGCRLPNSAGERHWVGLGERVGSLVSENGHGQPVSIGIGNTQ